MTSIRVLRGVVGNTLSSFVSRYSEWNGYWLFGFLSGRQFRLDLLTPSRLGDSILKASRQRAAEVFLRQLGLAGLKPERISGAVMSLCTDSIESGWYTMSVRLEVTTREDRLFAREVVVCAWSHDPSREARSGRGE